MVLDRMAYDDGPDTFVQACESEQEALREKLLAAQKRLPEVTMLRDLKVWQIMILPVFQFRFCADSEHYIWQAMLCRGNLCTGSYSHIIFFISIFITLASSGCVYIWYCNFQKLCKSIGYLPVKDMYSIALNTFR